MERRTALITGASSGLGAEFARLFAADGFDVALVARSGAVLEDLAQELEDRHWISAQVVPKDLSEPNAAADVVEVLREHGMHADVLVNSAGTEQFGPFAESDEAWLLDLLRVNMVTLTHLTRLVVPRMIERGWGRIVNLASSAAFRPGPLGAAYHASKAYVLSFSLGLTEELRGTGVKVTALCPGPTAAGSPARAEVGDPKPMAGGSLPDAAVVAEWGYEAVKRGKPFAVHGAKRRAAAFGTRFIPRTSNWFAS